MDRQSTTGTPGVYTGERQASVSTYLTSIVLLAGVFGGLVIVVTVILVCRYCQGHRKPVGRQVLRASTRDSSSERHSRYETINSDILSEPSSCSTHRPSLTPRSVLHFRYPDREGDLEIATETTHLKSDFDKDDYTEQNQLRAEILPRTENAESGSISPSLTGVQYVTEDGSRYNEGDYHHLKHSKIGRSLLRQLSMGATSSTAQGRGTLGDPQFRFSSFDEHAAPFCSIKLDDRLDGQRHVVDYHPLQQHQHHQLLPHQLQQHDLYRPSTERENNQRHSRDMQHLDDHFIQSRDRRETPSPNCRLARVPAHSPSSSRMYAKEDFMSLSSPPFKPVPELAPSLSPLHSRREDDLRTSPPSQFRPIKDTVRSAFSPHRPARTQVSVEVHKQAYSRDGDSYSTNSSEELHQRLLGRLDRARSHAETSSLQPKRPNLNRPTNSHSLESPRQNTYRESRKVRSYDDYLEDYDVLKITEFSKGPFYNTDYDVISELHSPTGSKVRYNDTGSLEHLNEDTSGFACGLEFEDVRKVGDRREQDHSEDTEDSAETLNGNRKYRALWRLRTTLEEEEECSDTIRMEDVTSPDDSPDREHVTPVTTSFESSAQSDPCPSDHRDSGIQFEISSLKPLNHVNFLHPNYENRRQSYRNIMSNRLKGGNQSTSVENSFDSVETDGDISDTSRYEMTTTSFESSTTTDNTDSTNESQASKLRQMKADSGYKSLENQQQNSKELGDHENAKWDFRASVECGEGIAARRDRRTSVERGEPVCRTCGHQGAVGLVGDVSVLSIHHGLRRNSGTSAQPRHDSLWKPSSSSSHFDRQNVKTASKKRREYSRDRQAVHVYESIHEPEADVRHDLHSRDKPEESSIHNKISVFARFFKSHPRGNRGQYLARDYSIDQKTNSIFNEFVRQEMPPSVRESAGNVQLASTGLPRMGKHRLQRKDTEPVFMSEGNAVGRNRLAPGMRSASLGSESSASSARRISPQDSIEEKDDEVCEDSVTFHRLPAWTIRPSDTHVIPAQIQTLSIHDIPVIKLSEQEVPDTS